MRPSGSCSSSPARARSTRDDASCPLTVGRRSARSPRTAATDPRSASPLGEIGCRWRPPAWRDGRRRHDPARGRRLVLRVGRAARRPVAPRPPRDRRAAASCSPPATRPRPTACGHRWARHRRDACARRRSSCGRGWRPTARRARRCSRSSTTRRRSWRDSRSTRRSWTSAGCGGSPARRREIAARPASRRARAGRDPRHGGRRADEVPGEGGERRRQARRPARRAGRRRARLPARVAGRAALGRRAGHRAEAPTSARSRPWPRWRRSASLRWCGSSGRAAGRHLNALAHNRDPRRVEVGRRRRSIGHPAGARSPATVARDARHRPDRVWSTGSRGACGRHIASAER